jgi:esterase/lipase superfamily enzyme
VKLAARWYSDRLRHEVNVVRWGETGTPVLLFPTAGGDAEEIERFLVIDCLADLLAKGRIKIFSCDSVAGRAWVEGDGTDRHRSWVQNQFHQFVLHELVPGIRNDCRSPEIEIVAAGASIGAFNALAVLCRFPHVFRSALCLSGTYNLTRFLKNGDMPEDFYFSSPFHFLPGLDGSQLDAIRRRFVLFASGQGRAEDIGESWRMAEVLGTKGIPNRVVPWGDEWPHDWPTWRRMLPLYLDELA